MSTGGRRRAREIALQVLYQIDAQGVLSEEQGIALFFGHLSRDEEEEGAECDEACRAFATALVRGVREHQDQLDEALSRASRNWRLERMARVDRNLLRLALFEMTHSSDVPAKVAINEAIEIAKRYGTAETPSFVNGILDRCLAELTPRSPGRDPR